MPRLFLFITFLFNHQTSGYELHLKLLNYETLSDYLKRKLTKL